MIGRLKDIVFGRDGEQIISFAVRTDYREEFDSLKDFDVDVDIKRHRQKRSLDANAYAWVIIGKIAAKTGIQRDEVYWEAIKSIGGNSETVCVKNEAVESLCRGWELHGLGWQTDTFPSKIKGCTNVILYYGSSVYDTEQMSRLIDNLVQDAQALGIPTETPEQIAKIKSLWASCPKEKT